jgi:phosphatidylserine/phosphatidylglycerophosphate/cardiolipin synthase-like enzyme
LFSPSLLDAINQVAIALPPHLLPTIAPFVETLAHQSPDQWDYTIAEAIATKSLRRQWGDLVRQWQGHTPPIAPEALVLALLTAQRLYGQVQADYSIQPIWTIPQSSDEAPRRTEQTILELIAGSRRDLLIICFAVYDVPQIVQALQAARDRGVTIRLIVELPETAQKIAFGIWQSFPGDLLRTVAIYHWPKHQRPRDGQGRIGSLHIKGIVADRRQVFISSANLTQYALQFNLELGLLTHQAQLAQHIQETIEAMIHQGILQPLPYPAPGDHESRLFRSQNQAKH